MIKTKNNINTNKDISLKTDSYLNGLKKDLIKILIIVQSFFSIIVIIYGLIIHLNIYSFLGQVSILLAMAIFTYLYLRPIKITKLSAALTLYYTLFMMPAISFALGYAHPLPLVMSLYTIVLIILLLEGKLRTIIFSVFIIVSNLLSIFNIINQSKYTNLTSLMSQTLSMYLSFTLIALSIWIFKSKFMILSDSLYKSSLIDTLTGAYNVRMLSIQLDHLKSTYDRYDENFAVAMVDLDNFKFINDQYGHNEGDDLLCEFVKYSQQFMRIGDEITRYGGDEFILVFPNCDTRSASKIMSRILKESHKISETYHDVSLTFSAGICDYKEALDLDLSILKLADQRMYIGKNNGKNTIISRN